MVVTPQKVGVLVIFIIVLIVLIKLIVPEINYTISSIDNVQYLVRNLPDKDKASDMLATINMKIQHLIKSLNDDKDDYSEYAEYINQLTRRIKGVTISESAKYSKYTSYSVNKGDEIVFCLRSNDTNKMHEQGIKIGIYNKIDFNSEPTEYCGMIITESII